MRKSAGARMRKLRGGDNLGISRIFNFESGNAGGSGMFDFGCPIRKQQGMRRIFYVIVTIIPLIIV